MNVPAALKSITSHGLVGAQPASSEAGDLSLEQEAELLRQIHRHRLGGVGVRALEAGTLGLSDDSAAALIEQHDAAMSASLRIEIEMLSLSSLLSDRGIDHRLLKGAALAHGYGADPADRPFRDVDLLIRGSDIDRAVEVLTRAGGERLIEELRPGFDRRFGKSVTMRRNGVEIDLHRLLAWGPFGVFMHPQDLFVLPSSVRIGAREVPTLSPTDHLLHACLHVALGQVEPALINCRDIALLSRSTIDWDRFIETVERWKCAPAIRRAFAATARSVSVELGLPDALSEMLEAADPAADQAALAPYVVSGDRYKAMARSMLGVLPPADRVPFAIAVGLPAGTSIRDRAKEAFKKAR